MKEIWNKDVENDNESVVGDQGSLSLYLKQISAYPLLSRDEEILLAQTIHVVKEEKTKLEEKLQYGEIDYDEFSEQGVMFEEEYEACRTKLITSNLRLVVSIAKNISTGV